MSLYFHVRDFVKAFLTPELSSWIYDATLARRLRYWKYRSCWIFTSGTQRDCILASFPPMPAGFESTEHFPVREQCQSLICPVTYTSISAWFDGCDLSHVQQTANIWTSVFLCDVLAMIRTLFTQLPLSPRSHFNTLHLLGRLLNSLIDAFLYFYLFMLSSLLWLVVTRYFYFKVRW